MACKRELPARDRASREKCRIKPIRNWPFWRKCATSKSGCLLELKGIECGNELEMRRFDRRGRIGWRGFGLRIEKFRDEGRHHRIEPAERRNRKMG